MAMNGKPPKDAQRPALPPPPPPAHWQPEVIERHEEKSSDGWGWLAWLFLLGIN